jgi:hypothetical protein
MPPGYSLSSESFRLPISYGLRDARKKRFSSRYRRHLSHDPDSSRHHRPCRSHGCHNEMLPEFAIRSRRAA